MYSFIGLIFLTGVVAFALFFTRLPALQLAVGLTANMARIRVVSIVFFFMLVIYYMNIVGSECKDTNIFDILVRGRAKMWMILKFANRKVPGNKLFVGKCRL